MQLTRHGYATIGLLIGLATFAVLLRSWALLAGAALLGAWLVTRAVLFALLLRRFDQTLTVQQDIQSTARPDETVPVTLSAHLAHSIPLKAHIAAEPPLVADAPTIDSRSVRLIEELEEATTTFTVRLPVAGNATFDQPSVSVTDGQLFTETFEFGDQHRVVVRPRQPDDMHIGEGGQEIAIGYGEHEALRPKGGGTEPESVREYLPSDSVRQIDWKATARMQSPQIREYRPETDRESMLLVDHRAATAVGLPGKRAQEYLREVALAFVEYADRVDDPLGCFTIGDEGITGRFPTTASKSGYGKIRRHLTDLSPTNSLNEPTESQSDFRAVRSPADARRAAKLLSESSAGAFGQNLTPYFKASEQYVKRIDGDPLFATTRLAIRDASHLIISTTDTNRAGIRETVKLARRGDRLVTVFLAPTMLYRADGLANMDSAYDEYLEFEEFRRELAGLDRVDAYEVAPGARLAAVLDRRSRRGASA
ncbi:DUF58 domain-containing protein [Halomarina rubra]|uniref:DUF58 domain-containing protein n=1 Tax=Halomarina rubra TaxID=2071873 RepID=A0ABD6AXA5_9EURY|nr:DUF58 domain-containing protein [Halomarina rubra]